VYHTCACLPACLCIVCIVAYVCLCCLNAYFVFSPICLQKFPFYHLVYRWCAFMFARICLLPRSRAMSSNLHTNTHTHTHTHTHVYIYIYIYPLAGSRTMLSYMYTCINTYMCIYIYVYVCVIINLCWLGQEQCSLVLARHLTVCIIFPMSCASFSPCS
jgi:hypothetical protein